MKDLQSLKTANNIECVIGQLVKSDCTVNPQGNKVSFDSGYLVSLYGGFILPIGRAANRNEIRFWVNKNYLIVRNKGLYFGRWTDNDQVYFDVSVHVETVNEAEALAKSSYQIAIWDCVANDAILLTGE